MFSRNVLNRLTNKTEYNRILLLARVAELADAHDSGSCWRQYGFKSLLSHQ